MPHLHRLVGFSRHRTVRHLATSYLGIAPMLTLACNEGSTGRQGAQSGGVEQTDATNSQPPPGQPTAPGSSDETPPVVAPAVGAANTPSNPSESDDPATPASPREPTATSSAPVEDSAHVPTEPASADDTPNISDAAADDSHPTPEPDVTPSLLVFSATTGYRHASIDNGLEALGTLAGERGWMMRATEDVSEFTDEGLTDVNVIVFLSPTGENLEASQRSAMERFIQAGNGFAGIHAASDTEYEWPWYGGLVGAYFNAHPETQPATIVVEDDAHPATQHLSATWDRTDEWYGFQENPRSTVNVLLALDESSYAPEQGGMGGDHPIAWYHEYDGGRSFYTALGHTAGSYQEAAFLLHIRGGIEWAAGAVSTE